MIEPTAEERAKKAEDRLKEAEDLLGRIQHIRNEWFNTPGDFIRLHEAAKAVDAFLADPKSDRCVHCTYADDDLYERCGRDDCANAKPPNEDDDG